MNVYYASEPSATKQGYIGLVIDGMTYATKMRTAHVYTDPVVAQAAAKKAWTESQEMAA